MVFQSALPRAEPQVFLAVPSRHVAQPKHRLFVSLPVLIFDQHLLRFAKRDGERERGWKEGGSGKEEGSILRLPRLNLLQLLK